MFQEKPIYNLNRFALQECGDFCWILKTIYLELYEDSIRVFSKFRKEVFDGSFLKDQHVFKIKQSELETFLNKLGKRTSRLDILEENFCIGKCCMLKYNLHLNWTIVYIETTFNISSMNLDVFSLYFQVLKI